MLPEVIIGFLGCSDSGLFYRNYSASPNIKFRTPSNFPAPVYKVPTFHPDFLVVLVYCDDVA